jgi:hypothetical protein
MEGLQYSNPLVPRRVVEIIDRAFQIYRENFIAFVALAAVVLVPITLVDLAVQPDAAEEYETFAEYIDETRAANNTSTLVTLLGLLIQGVIINGLITYMTSESNLGRRISVAEAFSHIAGRFLPLTGALIVAGILFLVMFVAVVLASVCIVPLIALPVVLYWGLCVYFFLVPMMILERVGILASIRRALILGKRRFWQNAGFTFGIWTITLVLTFAFSAFVLFVVESADEDSLLGVVVDLAIQIFITPILPIGLTLMYYDTRIRTEALDLALEAVDTLNPRPSDLPSPETRERLLTSKDVGNIIILTVIVIVFFAGIFILTGLAISSLTP